MAIFISHSSKDSDIVNSFVENILIKGMKFHSDGIFCTSIQGMDIKSGEDFKLRIKKELTTADIVIQIISDNYKESEVCLNEMGASWVLDATVIPFILPPVSFSNIGFIHNTTQLLRLNEKIDLLKFRSDHLNILETIPCDETKFIEYIDSFFQVLLPFECAFQLESKVELPREVFEAYFRDYLNPDVNHYNLMIKAQPNLADCKAIFNDEIYEDIFSIYSILYRDVLFKNESWEHIYTKEVIEYDSFRFTGKFIENKSLAPGGITRDELMKFIKPNTTLYSIRFKQKDEKYGVVFHSWAYINGRWVFFPKPWRFLESIIEIKDSKFVNRIYRWLKRFGLGNDLKKEGPELEILITHLINKLKNE